MNITVYCGSRVGNDPIFEETAKALGTWMGQNGHRLIYGGGAAGLMGTVADAVLDAGGEVYGVIPNFMTKIELEHNGLTKLIKVETMRERKHIMEEYGDAYVALPGGPGTMEEITEVISLRKLNRHEKPCILFSPNGFYNEFKTLYQKMVDADFLSQDGFDAIDFADDLNALKSLLAKRAAVVDKA